MSPARTILPLVTLLAIAAPALACDTPASVGSLRAEVVAGLNAARADAGLQPLRESSTLTRAAQSHACDNADRGSTSHRGSDGSNLTVRLIAAGYRFSTAAENTGRGFGDAARAVEFWMASAGHRENILLTTVRDIGVGIAMGEGRPHWVVNLGASR